MVIFVFEFSILQNVLFVSMEHPFKHLFAEYASESVTKTFVSQVNFWQLQRHHQRRLLKRGLKAARQLGEDSVLN